MLIGDKLSMGCDKGVLRRKMFFEGLRIEIEERNFREKGSVGGGRDEKHGAVEGDHP